MKNKLLILFLFFMLYLIFFNSVFATYSSNSFTEDDVEAILSYFNLAHDTATVAGYTSQINQVRSANNLSKMNVVFCLMDQTLYMVPSNGTVGNSESHLALFSSSTKVYLRQFNSFGYSGDEITSVSYTLIPSSYLITKYGNQTKSNWDFSWTYSEYIIYGANSQYVKFPYVLATFPTHTVASWVNNGQYDWRFFYNYIELDGWTPPVLPTPVPTATLTPSGETSVDLTETNSLIGGVITNTQTIIDNMPTSGDIAIATINANEDYWGTPEDVSGEKQEVEISSYIDEFISDSGDLQNLAIIQVLDDFEEDFVGILTKFDINNPYDFKIEWSDISFTLLGSRSITLIPSGEINFTALMNSNSTLSNLHSTLRVLFNFYFAFNLIVYLYNLVLSTLGIDNPYLYENPEVEYEDILTDEGGTTYVTHTWLNRKTHVANRLRYNSRR